jgi:LytS/YehU family sensor histidine kinase
MGDLLIYILPTHLFRLISLRNNWQQWEPKKLLIVVIPSILLIGWIFMMLTIGKNFLAKFYFWPPFNESFSSYFNSSWLVTWMTGIRLATIWILAYYLYHYAQARLKATEESARLRLFAKNAQLENLKTQLNPHFFFNSLNSIKALVSENPTHAKRAIDLLSELLRTSLYSRDTSLVTLQTEMNLIKDYLELEKIRFEDRLQLSIEMPESVLPIMILPLSVHTLVENAIKHGISNTMNGGTITISATQFGSVLTIVVQNPGKLAEIESFGLGLNNLRERLQLQYNGQAFFSIEMIGQKTVSSKLTVPI